MIKWVTDYYVAGRFGSTVEKTRIYPGHLPRQTVETLVQRHIDSLRGKGVAVYPQVDIRQEKIA